MIVLIDVELESLAQYDKPNDRNVFISAYKDHQRFK